MRNAGTDVKNVGTDVKNVGSDVKNLSSDVKNVGSDVKNVGSDVKNVGSDVKNVGTDVKNAGTRARNVCTQTTESVPSPRILGERGPDCGLGAAPPTPTPTPPNVPPIRPPLRPPPHVAARSLISASRRWRPSGQARRKARHIFAVPAAMARSKSSASWRQERASSRRGDSVWAAR
ncbi:MAG: hypothetical protein JWO56_124 [Acidobacteria bacterium]|nr:hypothetical protein [Acidobacteriota bacterium]